MSNRFGYPNVKVGELPNEQNIQNIKSYLNSTSESMDGYLEQVEGRLGNVEQLLEELMKSREA